MNSTSVHIGTTLKLTYGIVPMAIRAFCLFRLKSEASKKV